MAKQKEIRLAKEEKLGIKKAGKVSRDANMLRLQYVFTVDEQKKLMNHISLAPEIELGVITALINENFEEWEQLSFDDRIDWIIEEIINETLSYYLMDFCLYNELVELNVKIPDDTEIIVDRSYEGDTLLISLAIILGSEEKEGKVVSIFGNKP